MPGLLPPRFHSHRVADGWDRLLGWAVNRAFAGFSNLGSAPGMISMVVSQKNSGTLKA